jgi:hypothetical protein
MQPDSQKTYNAAQDLLHRGTPFGRVVLFRMLGGITRQPDTDAFLPEEDVWQADLFGILRTRNCCDEAILKWARAAKASIARRATDGRPDCPYNGTGPAPGSSPTPAA